MIVRAFKVPSLSFCNRFLISVKPTLYRSSFITIMSEFSSQCQTTSSTVDEESNRKKYEDIVLNASEVRRRIDEHCTSIGRDPNSVTLVAVSKTKPAEDIKALYDAGYRHFGENYFQELLDKAPALPNDIQWHFIGHLQSSKSARLVREVPNLAVVETVDSIKLATKLNNACDLAQRPSLDVYIQVDTSGEDTKSGIVASELNGLITTIMAECPRLRIRGLMTIGAPGDMTCFDRLAQCAVSAQVLFGPDASGNAYPKLQLSMGMSADFEAAITRGSSSVRVGSTIFGARH